MEAEGKPDLNILYIYNMPFRGIAKMAGGAVNMKMVNAVLEVINGRFFKGLGHLIGAWFHKGKKRFV
jgi:beta-glucosidase